MNASLLPALFPAAMGKGCHPIPPQMVDGGRGRTLRIRAEVTGQGDKSCWQAETQDSGPSGQGGAYRPRLLPQVLREGG